jgi:hypothetical protein
MILHNIPNYLQIDAEIAMDEMIPHPDDCGPRNFRMSSLGLIGNSPSRFTDDLDEFNEGVLVQFTMLKWGL